MSDIPETQPKTLITPPEGKITVSPAAAEAALETAGAEPLHDNPDQTPGPALTAPTPAPEAIAPAPAALPLLPNGDAPTTTRSVVLAYAGAGGGEVPAEATAIQELSTSLKSLDTVTIQATRALGQSASMQMGAKAALDNAASTHHNKFAAAVKHFGQELADEIRTHLIGVAGLKAIHTHEEVAVNLTPPPTPG